MNKPLKKEIDFFEFDQNRLEELKKTGKISNAKQYEMVLCVFIEFYRPGRLVFPDFDRSLMNEFKIYKMSAGLKNNSIIAICVPWQPSVIRDLTADLRPFSRIMPKLEKTRDKFIELEEIRMIFQVDIPKRRGKISNLFDLRNYFLLQFLLSGIDLIDLAHLRYDEHLLRGRLKFQLFKEGQARA